MTQLTISELIKKLEEVKKEHGDIKVLYDGEYGEHHSVYGIMILPFVDPCDEKKVEKMVVIGQ